MDVDKNWHNHKIENLALTRYEKLLGWNSELLLMFHSCRHWFQLAGFGKVCGHAVS